jgi:hypothetical protein
VANIRFSCEWLSAGGDEPVFRETSGQFSLYIDDICLTRNEDIWSKTVRDSVLVSSYPLAMWLASSWWRLNWEPLPNPSIQPSLDWRMAHEMGAANHGFVWPRVLFASDGEYISVWAEASSTLGQSVTYLSGLDNPKSLQVSEFQRGLDGFIGTVLNRLRAVGCADTELASLWELILEDRADQSATHARRLEAQMGFDPDECPDDVIAQALAIQSQTGESAMAELAPIFGKRDEGAALGEITRLGAINGMRGKPQVEASALGQMKAVAAPWQRGVEAAKQLRAQIGNADEPISNATLLSLLGLTEGQVEQWSSPSRLSAAVATPTNHEYFNFVPRKRHPVAKRFEFARFLGDSVRETTGSTDWLTSTDLATSRQKYQRAFAAEFLCPVQSLVNFLEEDFFESALEEAADHFDVSEQTVEALLINNGYLSRPYYDFGIPYRVTV